MSRHRHDDLAKLSLQLWLSPLGSTSLDARIAGEARRGDVLFVEKRSSPEHRKKLGLLGKLAHGTVLFELFRNSPTLAELSSCLAKRAELFAHELRAARRKKQPPESAKPPLVVVVTPSLSAERKRACGIAKKKGGGVHRLAKVTGCVLVVVNELPVGHETLWLRLMGRDAVQHQAIEELLASVRQEGLADATMRLILEWQASQPPVEEQRPEEQEQMEIWERYRNKFMKELDDAFREGKVEGKAEGKAEGEVRGKAEGKVEGKAEAVVAVLEGRGLKVTAEQRKRILACRDLARLDHWLLKALSVSSAAALLPAPRKPAAKAPSRKAPAARKRGR